MRCWKWGATPSKDSDGGLALVDSGAATGEGLVGCAEVAGGTTTLIWSGASSEGNSDATRNLSEVEFWQWWVIPSREIYTFPSEPSPGKYSGGFELPGRLGFRGEDEDSRAACGGGQSFPA
jgi:hypothetical protein